MMSNRLPWTALKSPPLESIETESIGFPYYDPDLHTKHTIQFCSPCVEHNRACVQPQHPPYIVGLPLTCTFHLLFSIAQAYL